MHSAWFIEDIRYIIFEHLSPGDLGRLARTCNALFEVATNELWKTATSYDRFLCCLPVNYRYRPLRAEHIQRIDFYGAKVQSLLIGRAGSQSCQQISAAFRIPKKRLKGRHPGKSWQELWTEIAAVRPASNFLVNLRHIRINNAVEDLLIPLIGISGTNLERIYIKYLQERKHYSIGLQILQQLQDTSKLEELFVRDVEPSQIPVKLIQQPSLRLLRVDARSYNSEPGDINFDDCLLPDELFRHPTLEHLTFGLTRGWYSPEVADLAGKLLPALKTLRVTLHTFARRDCPHSCANPAANSWTCKSIGTLSETRQDYAKDCGRRSPAGFFDGLGHPKLELLNVRFPQGLDGEMFVDVASAINRGCCLGRLTELALTSARSDAFRFTWENRDGPPITPAALRHGLKMLLPLPRLKKLELTVAPNFLDVVDLALYRSIADGLPALEELNFSYHGAGYSVMYDNNRNPRGQVIPLHHFAAFCSMIPTLVRVNAGTVCGNTVEESPTTEWKSLSVKSFIVGHWAGREAYGSGTLGAELLHSRLQVYFPNSRLANREMFLSDWMDYGQW